MQKEFIIRVVIVGDSHVGKSRLLHLMCRMTFTEGSTVGVDIACREVELEDVNYKLMFYDCAGDGRFNSITRSYMKDVAAVLVVYDVCERVTFERAVLWIKEIRREFADNEALNLILVGNKVDQVTLRTVEHTEGKLCAQQHGARFTETSALTGGRVELVVQALVMNVHSGLADGTIDLEQRKYGVRVTAIGTLNLEDAPAAKEKCCVLI